MGAVHFIPVYAPVLALRERVGLPREVDRLQEGTVCVCARAPREVAQRGTDWALETPQAQLSHLTRIWVQLPSLLLIALPAPLECFV